MMTVFRDAPEFAATIDAAAGRLGINAAIVEKDYWVTQALHILARDFPADFIFKGGTSLSKGYRLIHRFSEDVDILIIPRATKTATHTLMKHMADKVEAVLGGPVEVVSSEKGIHRNVRIRYRTAQQGSSILPDVLLEAGRRGGPQPSERLPIGCLLGDALAGAGISIDGFEDLQSLDVEVLHLARTLMEKLALVHSKLGTNPPDEQVSRYVRHYYDIHMLLGDDRALAVLRDKAEFGQIMESMREMNDRWFGGGELRPEKGWATSPAFDAARPGYERLQRAYDSAMAELHLGTSDPPSLDVICARVTALADLL